MKSKKRSRERAFGQRNVKFHSDNVKVKTESRVHLRGATDFRNKKRQRQNANINQFKTRGTNMVKRTTNTRTRSDYSYQRCSSSQPIVPSPKTKVPVGAGFAKSRKMLRRQALAEESRIRRKVKKNLADSMGKKKIPRGQISLEINKRLKQAQLSKILAYVSSNYNSNSTSTRTLECTGKQKMIPSEDTNAFLNGKQMSPPWMSSIRSAKQVGSLHEEIEAFLHYVNLKPIEFASRESLLENVTKAVKKCMGDEVQVEVFGSHKYGLSTFCSDLDMRIIIESSNNDQYDREETNMFADTQSDNEDIETSDSEFENVSTVPVLQDELDVNASATSKGLDEEAIEQWHSNCFFIDKNAREHTLKRNSEADSEEPHNVKRNVYTNIITSPLTSTSLQLHLNFKDVTASYKSDADKCSNQLTRKSVVDGLRKISKELCSSGNRDWLHKIHTRTKCRVPIISMKTWSRVEGDLSIAGFGFDSTPTVAKMAKLSGLKSLSKVLKLMLIQAGLDKPFSGGLGSFKLYVLVAKHLERISISCRTNQEELEVDLGGALVSFLGYHSSLKRLHRGLKVEFQDVLVDFESVFNLNAVVNFFYRSYKKLTKANTETKPDSPPHHYSSRLRKIFFLSKLKREREECLFFAQEHVNSQKSQHELTDFGKKIEERIMFIQSEKLRMQDPIDLLTIRKLNPTVAKQLEYIVASSL